MSILADIVSGNTGTADVFYLIGVIIAVLAALCAATRSPEALRWSPVLGWLALGCVSFGLLVL